MTSLGRFCVRATRTCTRKRTFFATQCRNVSFSVRQGSKLPHVAVDERMERFLNRYDTFMFDCDGVLWDNDHITPFPGVERALHKLQGLNKRLLFVTNNSTVSRQQLAEKLKKHGFETELNNIFCNTHASGMYLKNTLKVQGKVYIIGGKGIKDEMDSIGLENFGSGPDPDVPTYNSKDLLRMKFEENVSAVLVGFDEHVNFNKIYKAASYLQDSDCHFVATNLVEKGFNIAYNRRMPATGALVAVIAEVAQREPVVVGKPHRIMYDVIKQQHPEVEKARTVFIGDTLEADMRFAKTVGLDSALVLSGVSSMDSVKAKPHLAPDYILESLTDIMF